MWRPGLLTQQYVFWSADSLENVGALLPQARQVLVQFGGPALSLK